ncbi:hypothetical protein [Paenarthrobacter nitroguajacolicus]|uniref:hypothetical protein n=1 Tax=Paenarthrobacter nitroguajacolicus TaxID=211146 RepID=UPI0021175632|nr:hypothetical protein [Paenarthrobacter nitroguajacolicus]
MSEPDDKIPDERLTPLHEILQANHYDVNVTRTTNFMGTADDTTEQEQPDMRTLDESIKQLLAIEGATGAAVVDYSSGMALAQGGNPGFDLGVAAAGNSNVVSAKLRTMAELSVDGDIEDILITLGTQYHLINVLNSSGSKGLFVYLVLDRTYANLALARHKLKNLAKDITI